MDNNEKFNMAFGAGDYSNLSQARLKKLNTIADFLIKNKVCLPFSFIKDLIENKKIDNFIKNSDFRFFRGEPSLNITQPRLFNDKGEIAFCKLAYSLGCFSKEKIPLTDKYKAQKAVGLLAQIVKLPLKNNEYVELFGNLSYNDKASVEFLNFLSDRGKQNILQNFDKLYNLSSIYPNVFCLVLKYFNEIKTSRSFTDEFGEMRKLSWENAIIRFCDIFYKKLNERGMNAKEQLLLYGFDNSNIKFTKQLFDEVQALGVPEHILGKPLKEKTILEQVEKIKSQTANMLKDGEKLLHEVYDKEFTFEMLSKRDIKNAIIGVFCSCCATIKNPGYGSDIAVSTIMDDNVQNMVINDKYGNIVAKGTMYVNQKYGYAVFNDFEINDKYKKHELDIYAGGGYYNVADDSKEERERDKIFDAFMRGIHAFVEEYDKLHPEKPIKQVNVGMGFNRLKAQCDRYKKATNQYMLAVPYEYYFKDAEDEQRVLYRKNKKMANNDFAAQIE